MRVRHRQKENREKYAKQKLKKKKKEISKIHGGK
jgi:hypothetical protein